MPLSLSIQLRPDATIELTGPQATNPLDQNPERQLGQVGLERTFVDKASGKDTSRPQLSELCAFVRKGGTVIIHPMDGPGEKSRGSEEAGATADSTQSLCRVLEGVFTFTGEDSFNIATTAFCDGSLC